MSWNNDHIPDRDIEKLQHRAKAMYEQLRASPLHGKDVLGTKIPVPIILLMLDMCEIGDGLNYEKLVLRALLAIFGDLVDQENYATHVPIRGGYADIELHFRDEMLARLPHWALWRSEYGMRSFLVEVKNEKEKSSHEDIGQLGYYINLYKRGRFALIVARMGFTQHALKTCRDHNEKQVNDNSYLLLPLTHEVLKYLLQLSVGDSKKVKLMQQLRRIENRLSRPKLPKPTLNSDIFNFLDIL